MTLTGNPEGQESLKDVHLRLPASIHSELLLAARLQRMPLSNLLRMILRRWVVERGQIDG